MLNEAIDRYVELRRALGYQLHTTALRLRNFAVYAADRGEMYVCTRTAVAWAGTAPTPHARCAWFRDVRLFSQFANGDDPRHDLLIGEPYPSRWHRPVPYIYSEQEVARLGDSAGRIRPTWPYRRLVISTALGLIATTGLRASEALSLCIDDLGLGPAGHLTVRRTKFNKSRIVPLHCTAVAALCQYMERRRCFSGSEDHLFVSARGGGLRYSTLLKAFHEARLLAGIEPEGRRVPRIHDLRHYADLRIMPTRRPGRLALTDHAAARATADAA